MWHKKRVPGGLLALIYSLIVMGIGFGVYKLLWAWFHSLIALFVLWGPATALLSIAAIFIFNAIFRIDLY